MNIGGNCNSVKGISGKGSSGKGSDWKGSGGGG